MNYANYPIVLLENAQETFKELRNKVRDNEDLLRIAKDENLELKIDYTRKGYSFYFKVSKPQYSNHRISFTVSHIPASRAENGLFSLPMTSTTKLEVVNRFNHWLGVLNEYESLNIHPKDKILRDYENRFHQAISFLVDENDDKGLSFQNKTMLKEFLGESIEFIKSSDSVIAGEDEINEIIEELIELNKYLPQLTQGQIKKKFAVLYSKVYYKGIDIVNWMFKEGKGFGFGQILSEAFKGLLG